MAAKECLEISSLLLTWGWGEGQLFFFFSNSHICEDLKTALSRGKATPQGKLFLSDFLCIPSLYMSGKMGSEVW